VGCHKTERGIEVVACDRDIIRVVAAHGILHAKHRGSLAEKRDVGAVRPWAALARLAAKWSGASVGASLSPAANEDTPWRHTVDTSFRLLTDLVAGGWCGRT